MGKKPKTEAKVAKPAKTARPPAPVYQIKITLVGAKPPIWRRLHVRGDTTLREFNIIIQEAMGWLGGHLHEFDVDGTAYGDPRESEPGECLNEAKYTLQTLITGEKQVIRYTYDFGDDWEHKIVVEKILPPAERVLYPVCVAGKRAAPPEDCGGMPGYYNLLDAMENTDHPDRDELLEWLDEDYDPDTFSLDVINERLARLRR